MKKLEIQVVFISQYKNIPFTQIFHSAAANKITG